MKLEVSMQMDPELLRSVYEESPIGMEIYDASGKLVDVNRSCLEIFGVEDVSEIKGFELFEDPNLPQEMKDKLKKGEAVRYEAPFDFNLVRERGLYRTSKTGLAYLDVLVTPLIRDQEGAPSAYLVQVQDITMRRLAEEGLRESEDKFRDLVEQSNDGIVLIDRQGTVLLWNKAMEDISGLRQEEVLGKYLWDVQYEMAPEERKTPQDYERLKSMILEGLRDHEAPWFGKVSEREAQTLGGERKSIASTVFPIKTREGFMIASINRDVSERKRYEESLWKYSYELQERIKELNCLYNVVRIIEQPGISLEMILQRVAEILPPALRYPEIARARIVFEGQEFRSAAFRETRWRLASPIYVWGSEAGRVEVFYLEDRAETDKGAFLEEEGIMLDAVAERLGRLIERLRLERALRESEKEFRLLAENAQDLIYRIRLRPERRFEYVSPSATAITGYTPQEHYDDPDLGFKLVHPEDRHLLEKAAAGEVEEDKPLTLRWIKKDGSIIWTEQRNVVIYDQSGEAVAIEGVARDVTERRKAMEELEKANQELETYANVVSHDLRGPISLIISAAGTLSEVMKRCGDEAAAEQVEEVASLILRSALNAVDLINSVLGLARAGQKPKKVSEVDVGEAVRSVLQERSALIEERGLRVVVDDDLGTVMADPTHIYQLFSNLISNAVEYNDSPEPSMSVSYSREGDTHLYKVCDNGSGISTEEAEKLFLPLYRGKQGGTGLGLAIVKKIVEIYGGRIEVHNHGGTCFEFTLRDYQEGP